MWRDVNYQDLKNSFNKVKCLLYWGFPWSWESCLCSKSISERRSIGLQLQRVLFSKYFTFISREASLKGMKICCGLHSTSEPTDNPGWCLQFIQGPIIWFCLRDDLLCRGASTVSDYPIHRTTWPWEQNISLVLPELLSLGVVSVAPWALPWSSYMVTL